MPALQATIATMTGEALAAKKTINSLNDEITRLTRRLPAADLWDAQVSRLAAEARAKKVEEEQAARDKVIAAEEEKTTGEIRTIKAQIQEITDREKVIANTPLMFPHLPVPPPSEYWKAQLKRRDDLNHRLSGLEGRVSPEQEAARQSEVRAKALLAEVLEDQRAKADPHGERDPSDFGNADGNVWRDIHGRPVR